MNRDTEGVYVALLRGINVGGKHKLPMSDLVSMFDKAGCSRAQAYIQSGNVIFRASKSCAAVVPSAIAKAVAAKHGFEVPVITRSAAELAAVVGKNPFLRAGVNLDFLHVMFLADKPARGQIAALDPDRSPPDAIEVQGCEIYLRCPNGAARTKFTNAYFDAKLETTSTMRNWRTVQKLAELVRSLEGVQA